MFKRLLICELLAIIADECMQAQSEILHDIGSCLYYAESYLYSPWM